MEGMLSTKNFRRFYESMSVDASSILDYFDVMKRSIGIIEEDIKLGYLRIIVNSPATSLEFQGIQDRSVIYQDKSGYNDKEGLRQTFVTDDWGILQVEIYPKNDTSWDDVESEEITFLIKIIFDSICKARAVILMHQATITDALTGACNMAGVVNHTGDYKKAGSLEKYDAIYLNIKNFKYINQRIGSKQADKVLRDFSRMVRDYLVKGELFGRLDTDTFFILIEKDRTEEGIKFITTRRVLVELEKKSMEFDLLVRLGVYHIHPVDSTNRVIEASQAAYEFTLNPSAGDVVYFREDMLRASIHDEEISNDFYRALKKKEFVVYYQPKVDLKTDKLVSAEALCRWLQNGEIVPPMDFIPVLEREGSICDLDFYMLNTVCEHITEWMGRGIEPVKISVNFSRTNVLNKKLAEKIVKVINSHKVDSQFIEIEITEMSGYEDFESLSEFVDIMKENGIETSIDDFGTGYSSLNLIKDLNVDTVKIDKSFLEKITNEDSQDKRMVKNIINMVNELHMKVVAEGVETHVQRDFLKSVNCQVAQGFLFDKPLPKEKFEFRLLGERMY